MSSTLFKVSHRQSNEIRQGINLHCSCTLPYSPVDDHQRYCKGCQSWFHKTCLNPALPTATPSLQGPLANRLLNFPIMRGASGNEVCEDWVISGSGRKVLKAREWQEKGMLPGGVVPPNLRAELDDNFVIMVETSNWTYYKCPTCSSTI